MLIEHTKVLESRIGNAILRTTGFTQEELELLFFEFLPEALDKSIDYKLLVEFTDFLNKKHCTSNERSASITIT